MGIMEGKHWFIEEIINLVKSADIRLQKKKSVGEVPIGVQNVKNNFSLKKALLRAFFNILPGIELFSQGATPQISSPLMRFTTEFEMDRSGSTSP